MPVVGRLSQFFHHWIQQEICNKSLIMLLTTPQICSCITLWNLECPFCHFTTTAVTKIDIKLPLFFTLNAIHIFWHILLNMLRLNSNCLSCARSVLSSLSSSVSSLRTHSLSVSHFSLLKWETPICSFQYACGPNHSATVRIIHIVFFTVKYVY